MSTLRMFKGGNVRSVVARNARNLKLCLAVVFAAMLATNAKAQCPPASSDITQYTFSTGVGTSSDWISASTTKIVNSGIDDGAGSLYSLGFTFVFEGTNYTQISANTNGQMRLGSTVISASPYSQPLNSSNAGSNNPKIIGIGKDLSTGSAGGVWYGTSGSAPNRIGVVTFQCNYSSSSSGTSYLNWQIQLYEATGEIKIVYNTCVSTPSSYQVGIVGANSANVVTIDPSLHTKANGANTTTYSVWPGQYRYYRFTPPVLTCPPVYNLAYNNGTLTWTECGTATQWLVEYGRAGFTPGTGTQVLVNTNSYNFSSFASGMYTFYVRPYCGVGDTGSRQQVNVQHNFTYCGGNGTQANPYLI